MSATSSRLRAFWFQIHGLLGITAGLVLCVVGVSGAAIAFEEELLRALNPGLTTVAPRAVPPLTAPELQARLAAQQPGRTLLSITVYADPSRAAKAMLAAAPVPVPGASRSANPPRRADTIYLDPYDGRLLGGTLRGEETLHWIEDLHRRLLAGKAGQAVTGACAILLVVLALSGLYLRWPRQPGRLRAWLHIDWRRHGRMLWRNLHMVAGTVALLFYLCSALTGLFWSYDWYRQGVYALAGEAPPARLKGSASGKPIPVDLAPAWTSFREAVPKYRQATFMPPSASGQPLQVSYLASEPPHGRAVSRLSLDPASGAVREHQRYADKTVGGQVVASMFPLHSGEFFGWTGRILTALASLGLPLFAVTGWMLYLDRRALRRRAGELRRERLAREAVAQEQVEA